MRSMVEIRVADTRVHRLVVSYGGKVCIVVLEVSEHTIFDGMKGDRFVILTRLSRWFHLLVIWVEWP